MIFTVLLVGLPVMLLCLIMRGVHRLVVHPLLHSTASQRASDRACSTKCGRC